MTFGALTLTIISLTDISVAAALGSSTFYNPFNFYNNITMAGIVEASAQHPKPEEALFSYGTAGVSPFL